MHVCVCPFWDISLRFDFKHEYQHRKPTFFEDKKSIVPGSLLVTKEPEDSGYEIVVALTAHLFVKNMFFSNCVVLCVPKTAVV